MPAEVYYIREELLISGNSRYNINFFTRQQHLLFVKHFLIYNGKIPVSEESHAPELFPATGW